LPWHGAALPEPLQPTSKWVVDFADNQCAALRSFGSEKEPVRLALKSSPTSGVVQISLVLNGPTAEVVQEESLLTFGSGKPVKLKQLRFKSGNTTVRRINLGPAEVEALSQSNTLTWRILGKSHELAPGAMGPVMKMMALCRDDLRKYWNIDPGPAAKVKEKPRPLKFLASAFSTDDYPSQAVRNGDEGQTGIVLLVDEKGRLADCMIEETSNIATLDAMACFVIHDRVKFAPAVGTDGKPVRSYLTQRIRWIMP
jgi:hypothetical protein